MAEENTAPQTNQRPPPQLVNPRGDEYVDMLKKTVPATEQGIFSSFSSQSSTVPAVIGALVGTQNTDIYSIAERTNLPAKHRATIRRMIQLAEHGIGGPLDIPKPFVARQVVMDLRLRVSETDETGHGKSRAEVENIMTGWIAKLEAREAEAKKSKGVAN